MLVVDDVFDAFNVVVGDYPVGGHELVGDDGGHCVFLLVVSWGLGFFFLVPVVSSVVFCCLVFNSFDVFGGCGDCHSLVVVLGVVSAWLVCLVGGVVGCCSMVGVAGLLGVVCLCGWWLVGGARWLSPGVVLLVGWGVLGVGLVGLRGRLVFGSGWVAFAPGWSVPLVGWIVVGGGYVAAGWLLDVSRRA